MSLRKNFLNVIPQIVVILAILFSTFAPSINVDAQTTQVETTSSTNKDINVGVTIGENTTPTSLKVPILSEEISKQAQNQSNEALRIKLSAEPAIYIEGKPIVISWILVGGNAGKTSGIQIVARPSDGIVPTNAKIIPEADGSVIISPTLDDDSIAWKVLDNAEFPISFSFDLVMDGKIVNTNSVLVDQPLVTTSITQTARMQSDKQSNKNKIQVTVPSNAANAAMLMSMRHPSPNALSSASLSWNPIEVIAVDKNTAKNITKFKNPITIQITYDEQEIFDWTEKDLSIYYYDPDLLDWFPMETSVDTANNTLTAQSDHLTVFDYKANNWQSTMLPTVDAFKTSDFTGAATYQVNMWTPPAPGGLQPSVVLSYNSQIIDESSVYQQSSWTGMGWDLDTGMVTRNMHGTDADWSDDTFSISAGGISGQLLPISGSGGVTQYNTADQSFMKVEGNDNTYSFTAWTKDGTKYEFKETIDTNTNNGCATSNNITWRWSLTKVTDIHGNTLNYTYYTEGKSGCANEIYVYPATITYGNGKYSVNFVPEARTDYQTSWTTSASRTLYGKQRLKEVQIKHNGVDVKRYVMSYAPDNSTNIYPNFAFSAGGKTLTLAGVQEFGSDGSALPAVTFTYADNMHLTTVNNGQGGSVQMSYAAWQYIDDINKDIRSLKTTFNVEDCAAGNGPSPIWTQVSGTVRCDDTRYLKVGNYSTSFAERTIPENMIKPSASYTFLINARAISQDTTVSWGIRDTATDQTTMLSSAIKTTSGDMEQKLITLPVTYNPAAIKLRLVCNNCFFRSFEFIQFSILYRVTARTVTVQPTNIVSTHTYQYDNASPATVDNSAAVATGGTLYTKKLREFRGNAMSQVTNPDGLTTVNWFWQADGMKGRGYDSLVLKRTFFDDLNALNSNWTTSGTNTAVAEYQKDFDNSIKSVNGTLTHVGSLGTGNVAVAHIRLSGANAAGQVGLQGSTVISLANGSASVNGASLLSGSNFKLDEWYAVMIFADTANGNRVRIWQLDDPNNSGEAVVGGGGGAFFSSVSNGTIYTDSYFEGTPYSETITRFGSTVQYDTTSGGTFPDIPGATLMTFKDLSVIWVYPTSVENRNYNGDAAFVGTRQDFTYATAAQFGNLLNTVESGNDGSGWSVYRKSNYEYYPVVSPAITPTRYLTAFPARQTVTDAGNNLLGETLYFYDNQTAYTSPPIMGDLTTQRVWAGGSDYAQTSMTYDSYGNLLTQSGYTEYGTATSSPSISSSQTTTTVYDSAGYNTYPVTVTNQLGQTVNTAYNYALGLPNSVTHANSVTTSATYDGFGRMKTITAPGDSSPTLTVNYFDASMPFKVDLIQTVSASSAIRLSRFYDGAGRQIQTQTANAVVDGSLQNIVVDTQYNAAGRMVKQTVPYTIGSNATPSFSAQSFTQPYTSTVYDVIGRALTTTSPNSASVSYSYADLTTTVQDPKLNSTTTTMDVWGRTLLVDAPTGPDVSYEYNVLNQLTDATRAGATTHIEYDILGRKLNMSDPDMGYWQYTYDALGNLRTQTDAKNQLTCLYYDALNRLDGKVYSSSGSCGTPVSFDVDYTYDAGSNGIGRRTSMTDTSGSTVWTYDLRGRLSTETKTITGAASPFITSWQYNTGDLPIVMTYPDGETLTYGYNSDGTLNNMASNTTIDPLTGSGQVYLNAMQYDEAGRLKLMQYGNNIINKTFNYFSWNTADMGGLLSSVAAASASPLQNLAYAYDKNGNILTIVDALAGGQTQTFEYDTLNRITSANVTGGTDGLYSESYEYDSASGNLSLKNGLTYTYGDPAHIHAATALSNGNSYVYDSNGNMTTRNIGVQAFDLAYDAENRMTSVASGGGQAFAPRSDFTVAKQSNLIPVSYLAPMAFASNKESNAPMLQSGDIFADEFESGSFSAWSSANTGGGDLSVSIAAAHFGSYGMEALINDLTTMYVTDSTPVAESEYRARFYFDPNSISIPTGQGFAIFSGVGTAGIAYRIMLNNVGGQYKLQAQVFNDAGMWVVGQNIAMTDDWQVIEIDHKTPSAVDANDGYIKLWLNDALVDTISTLDNDTRTIDGASLGAVSSLDTGTNGTIYFDAFVSNRSGYIGPLITTTPTPSDPPTVTSTLPPETGTPTDTPTATSTPTATLIAPPTPTETQASSTIILQPNGTVGMDTYLLSTSTTTNFGTEVALAVGESNNAANRFTRSLIKFDLSSIPANAIITSATLSLWTANDLSDNDCTIRIYRLKTPFDELQATWSQSAAGVSWQSAGATGANDRETTHIGSTQILANESLGTEKQISLAPDKVQELLNGTLSNNGFIIMTDPELNDRFNYKSSDSSTSSNRPKLVIQYSLNGPITPTDTPTAMPPTSTPTSTTTVTNTPTPTATFTPTPPPVPVFSQADFTYDGDGHRVKSVITTDIASTTTYFVGNHYEVTGAEVTKYYYAGSQRIAMRKNGTLNYILGDHLGSTSLVTDAAGVIMSEQQYKAWGETRSSSGTEVTKYQYTGQYSYASDFGLMFYNARWYDSSLGRFAQADTIVPGGVQGYDRYAYTNNNPIKYTDPSGHESGDCYDRGYCTKKYQLRKDFDNFDKVPTYNKKEMKPVQFIYGITKEFNPDEYSLFQKEDGKIDQQKLLRYGVISDKAIKTATSLFPDDENPDGMRNAFQHAYWNALLTKEFGIEFAEAITNSHEKNYDAKRETQFMDLYNNAVGRRLGENSDSKDSMVLLAVVYNAVLRGDMIVLEKNKSKYDVYFSDDCVGSCISP